MRAMNVNVLNGVLNGTRQTPHVAFRGIALPRDLSTFPQSEPPSCSRPSFATSGGPLLVRCPASAQMKDSSVGVPPILHFVYGLKVNASFGFVQYAAVASALAVHRPESVYFHYFFSPQDTAFWRAVLPFLSLVRHTPEEVTRESAACLSHHAHLADWLRLRELNEHGGLYLDMDSFSLAPLPPQLLAGSAFVIAKQLASPWVRDKVPPCVPLPVGGAPSQRPNDNASQTWSCGNSTQSLRAHRGLCNAVMAGAPASRFGTHWFAQYAHFRSIGKDVYWDEHSVVLPARLWERCDELRPEVTVLPSRAFFPFYWPEAARLLRSNWTNSSARILEGSYVMHLWGDGAAALIGQPEPPRHPAQTCSAAFARTLYGHLACRYAGGMNARVGR